MKPLTETAFRKIIARISVGGRPKPTGVRITEEQFWIIDSEVAKQMDQMSSADSRNAAKYVREWQQRIINNPKPKKTMHIIVKSHKEQNKTKVHSGMLTESTVTGNLYIVTRIHGKQAQVTVLNPAEPQYHIGETISLPLRHLIPYYGEITLTQRR